MTILTQRSALKSLTLQGAAVVAVSIAAHKLGVTLPEGAAHSLVAATTDLLMTLGFICVAVGRARARGPLE